MIATGDYKQLAAYTAPAFEWATGLQLEVLEPEGEPFRAKLELDDAKQYIFVDADVMFLRRWAVPDVPLDAFAAERAFMFERNLGRILQDYPVSRGAWVNTGLFIASAKHRAVMARARELFDLGFSQLHEETVLNIALAEAETPRVPLRGVQTQRGYNAGERAAHLSGFRGVDGKLAQLRWLLWWQAGDELKQHLAAAGVKVLPQPRVLDRATFTRPGAAPQPGLPRSASGRGTAA